MLMAASELIEGHRRLNVLQQLRRNRTLLRLELQDDIFTGLTLVLDLQTAKKDPFFRIDPPDGFHAAVRGHRIWRFKFEFIDRDNIQYAFATAGGYLSGEQIWIKFPEFIQRNQRRQHFRLRPPRGTRLLFRVQRFRGEMQVRDIGMGGSLGALVRMKPNGHESPAFCVGDTLADVELTFSRTSRIPRVRVKKAVVKRFETAGTAGPHLYPLEFVQMDQREERRLLEVLYHLQRNQLRQRLPLDG